MPASGAAQQEQYLPPRFASTVAPARYVVLRTNAASAIAWLYILGTAGAAG